MARLPVPGSDDGSWGDVLNTFLQIEHNADGTLKASGSLATKADDTAVVHKTGTETISGAKTFAVSPTVPTPSSSGHPATKQYVDTAASRIDGGAVYVEDYGAVGDGTTDDSTAIKNAIATAVTAAQSGSGYAEVRFQSKTYFVNTPTTGGATNGSALIPLPVVPVTSQKVTLVLRGASESSGLYHWNQTTVQKAGTTLRTTYNAGNSTPATGEISVLGGPTPFYGYGYPSGLFSNLYVVVDGLTAVVPQNPRICGFDFRGVAELRVKSASVLAASTATGAPSIPDPVWGWAFSPPDIQNNALCDIDSLSIEGHISGLRITEHVRVNSLRAINCFNGIVCDGSSGFPHSSWIGYACVENCNRILANISSRAKLNIAVLDIEPGTDHVINDTGNGLVGIVNVTSNGSTGTELNANILNDGTIGVNGASNLRIVNMELFPGAVATPTVPATATPLRNPFWRDAGVSISGSVTSVKVDGVALGLTGTLTGATVFVPTGQTIELGYSGATPTWVWTIL
jgi:archaellum component FlaF (FlaF/FlaG flagellin family)